MNLKEARELAIRMACPHTTVQVPKDQEATVLCLKKTDNPYAFSEKCWGEDGSHCPEILKPKGCNPFTRLFSRKKR